MPGWPHWPRHGPWGLKRRSYGIAKRGLYMSVNTLGHPAMPKALWYVGPGMAELRDEPITPRPDDVRVRAHFGAISRGTEALVFAGRVPKSEYARMRGPHMGGAFPHPVKYCYAVVGQVEAGPAELAGRMVFALHPHQDEFALARDAVAP